MTLCAIDSGGPGVRCYWRDVLFHLLDALDDVSETGYLTIIHYQREHGFQSFPSL